MRKRESTESDSGGERRFAVSPRREIRPFGYLHCHTCTCIRFDSSPVRLEHDR